MLMPFVPSYDDSGILALNKPRIIAAYKTLAAANGLGVIDIYRRWVSYPVSNALGLYLDVLHPNATGYWDIAAAPNAILRAI